MIAGAMQEAPRPLRVSTGGRAAPGSRSSRGQRGRCSAEDRGEGGTPGTKRRRSRGSAGRPPGSRARGSPSPRPWPVCTGVCLYCASCRCCAPLVAVCAERWYSVSVAAVLSLVLCVQPNDERDADHESRGSSRTSASAERRGPGASMTQQEPLLTRASSAETETCHRLSSGTDGRQPASAFHRTVGPGTYRGRPISKSRVTK